MPKPSAEELSRAGDAFLGRPYDEMDCQEFVERCLRAVGIREDLKGSNAWYRKCLEEGWAGTPEECVRVFGSVPKGAFLFIHAFDGGEEKRGYRDGLGNASHIGIVTGRGKGAIHSSRSLGCVAESVFRGKTVQNGGWNRVGLWNRLDYGINEQRTTHNEQCMSAGGEVKKKMTATVTSPNGGPVNLRKKPDRSSALADRIPAGTEAELLESRGGWSRIRVKGKTGWMMTEFLQSMNNAWDGTDPSGVVPAAAEGSHESYSVTFSGLDLAQARAIMNDYPHNSVMEKEVG